MLLTSAQQNKSACISASRLIHLVAGARMLAKLPVK